MSKTVPLAIAFLASIVGANLAVKAFGLPGSIVAGFLLIGLDLTVRDALHERWRGAALPVFMGLLILAGGLITLALNLGAGEIVIASVAAFTISATADAIVYAAMDKRPRIQRVVASNGVGAALDTLVFVGLAFGGEVLLYGGPFQFSVKFIGGFVWAVILHRAGLLEPRENDDDHLHPDLHDRRGP